MLGKQSFAVLRGRDAPLALPTPPCFRGWAQTPPPHPGAVTAAALRCTAKQQAPAATRPTAASAGKAKRALHQASTRSAAKVLILEISPRDLDDRTLDGLVSKLPRRLRGTTERKFTGRLHPSDLNARGFRKLLHKHGVALATERADVRAIRLEGLKARRAAKRTDCGLYTKLARQRRESSSRLATLQVVATMEGLEAEMDHAAIVPERRDVAVEGRLGQRNVAGLIDDSELPL